MIEYVIKKDINGNTIEFKFQAKEDSDGDFVIDYMIPGYYENKNLSEFRAKGLSRKIPGIIFYSPKKLFGQKVGGFTIPQDIYDQLLNYEEQLKEKKLDRINEEQRAIREGDIPIKVSYQEGEYLSAYQVFGYSAKLLEEIGLAKYINGWGTKVNDDVVTALGETFTYPQIKEFARPMLEKKQQQKEEAKKALDEKIDEAKRTGKPVEISRVFGPCSDPAEECDLDLFIKYAMPDGSIKTVTTHTW